MHISRNPIGRTVALVASAMLLASLTVAAPASAATPTCDGHTATIVGSDLIIGTDGPDVIVGSNGADTIEAGKGRDIVCGRGGDDVINGEGARDRIFGGSGNDVMAGGPGDDDLFGWRGKDFIHGQDGNDFINGGPGTDECRQGSGNGRIRNCEKADLKIKVISPANAPEGTITFKVKVKNRGPQAASYSIDLDETNRHARCFGPPPWEGFLHEFGKLRPGAKRITTYQVTCEIEDADPWVEVEAEVLNDARDPRKANNEDTSRTILEE
jgi:hypothetical protein